VTEENDELVRIIGAPGKRRRRNGGREEDEGLRKRRQTKFNNLVLFLNFLLSLVNPLLLGPQTSTFHKFLWRVLANH
jgi:hypothetical protein